MPLLDPEAILGGLYVSRDGLCKAGNVCHRAAARGRVARGRVPRPDRGARLRHPRTGACAGSRPRRARSRPPRWSSAPASGGKSLQALTGVPMPLQPMQHLFAYTSRCPSWPAPRSRRAPDPAPPGPSIYYRQRGDAYGIGSYGHEPLPIERARVRARGRRPTTAQGEFTPEHFATPATPPTPCCRRCATPSWPTVQRPLLVHARRQPAAGRVVAVRGLWLAEGSGSRTPAARPRGGRADHDRPQRHRLRPAHPDRFQPHHPPPTCGRAAPSSTPRYTTSSTRSSRMLHPRGLRTTPYHQRFEEARRGADRERRLGAGAVVRVQRGRCRAPESRRRARRGRRGTGRRRSGASTTRPARRRGRST